MNYPYNGIEYPVRKLTTYEKLEAENMKRTRIIEMNYRCEHCHGDVLRFGTPQMAHKVAKSKMNIKKYGTRAINNKKNLVLVCCGSCNDAQNIGQKTLIADKLMIEIYEDLNGEVN